MIYLVNKLYALRECARIYSVAVLPSLFHIKFQALIRLISFDSFFSAAHAAHLANKSACSAVMEERETRSKSKRDCTRVW